MNLPDCKLTPGQAFLQGYWSGNQQKAILTAALISVREYIEKGFSDDSPHYHHGKNAMLELIDAAPAREDAI